MKFQVKNDFQALLCENSADVNEIRKEQRKNIVPRHGLGMKIVRSVAECFGGMIGIRL